ncbi:PEP-CTERM domain protein [Oopsacas minuta]|uniref:PEP-CTERM domain protein n=1 Tax=Oopsacas minuta TaxID=111878 RepID=A0AAV7KIX0_9METZ|nr:PEP-CTERM domain protein [Oopsacas minuta]
MDTCTQELIHNAFVINQIDCGKSYAAGLAIDPETSKIYISDWKGNCVHVYDKDLKENSKFNNKTPIRSPRGLRFKDGMLYVAESNGNIDHSCVKVFLRDGTFIQEIGHWGSHEQQFRLSLALDVDEYKNIYICDRGHSIIKVMTSEGKLLSKFGRENLKWPIDIRIYKTFIYVLDHKYTHMFVFDLEHNFVTEFCLPSRYTSSYFVINSEGEIIFSDNKNGRLVKINGFHTLIYHTQLPHNRIDISNKGIEMDREEE